MLIHYLSYLYGLRSGDFIFTGTPASAGRVSSGDTLKAVLSISGNGVQCRRELVNLHARVI